MCHTSGVVDGCTVRVVKCGPADTVCCHMPRRFKTKKEKQEALEGYRDQLRNELEGVEERIKDLGAD
jgi:hypothetical protein